MGVVSRAEGVEVAEWRAELLNPSGPGGVGETDGGRLLPSDRSVNYRGRPQSL